MTNKIMTRVMCIFAAGFSLSILIDGANDANAIPLMICCMYLATTLLLDK